MRKTVTAALALMICNGHAFPERVFGTETEPTTEWVCTPCGGDCDNQVYSHPGKCPSCGMALIPKDNVNPVRVAIVVHDQVELLDFAGPGEVFQDASMFAAEKGITFKVFTVAPGPGPVVSQSFVKIEPEFTIDNCPKPDILVVPGGATKILVDDPEFMAWVKTSTKGADMTLTVCTGAFVLGTLGLLDGREATTHWARIESLRDAFPKAKVLENVRYADAGKIITSAGVSAGIDGALHVVARFAGLDVARKTARFMEYPWREGDETSSVINGADQGIAAPR